MTKRERQFNKVHVFGGGPVRCPLCERLCTEPSDNDQRVVRHLRARVVFEDAERTECVCEDCGVSTIPAKA